MTIYRSANIPEAYAKVEQIVVSGVCGSTVVRAVSAQVNSTFLDSTDINLLSIKA